MLNKLLSPLIFLFSILITLKTYTWITTIGSEFVHPLPKAIYYLSVIAMWILITFVAPIQIAISKEAPQGSYILIGICIFVGASFGSILGYTIIDTAETAWSTDATYSAELIGIVWLGYILVTIITNMALPIYFVTKGLNLVPN